jgi:pyruvate formate lyase activating enzyme
MKIGGIQKVSLIDFPGKISTVVFTQGCNFRCEFCHNPSLVLPEMFDHVIDDGDVLSFLESRKGLIDGVVLSGGEPTIQVDLCQFIEKIKKMGFLVKLDTNGTNPDVLSDLYSKNLLDYVAMDIKHVLEKYSIIVGKNVDIQKIQQSISIIINSGVDYEFRTTIVPKFHSVDDIKQIVRLIDGANCFVFQEFVPDHAINHNLSSKNSIFDGSNSAILDDLINFCKSMVKNVILRRAK